MQTKLYTMVVEVPVLTDPMAMMVPLMRKGTVKSLRGADGDLLEWREKYREQFAAAWNGLPPHLRKPDGELRAMFDFLLATSGDTPVTAEQLGLR